MKNSPTVENLTFTYRVVTVLVMKVKCLLFFPDCQYSLIKYRLTCHVTLWTWGCLERYMYTFRPIRLDAKAKKKYFLPPFNNLFTTCELFEGEDKYFNAFCTEYGAI